MFLIRAVPGIGTTTIVVPRDTTLDMVKPWIVDLAFSQGRYTWAFQSRLECQGQHILYTIYTTSVSDTPKTHRVPMREFHSWNITT